MRTKNNVIFQCIGEIKIDNGPLLPAEAARLAILEYPDIQTSVKNLFSNKTYKDAIQTVFCGMKGHNPEEVSMAVAQDLVYSHLPEVIVARMLIDRVYANSMYRDFAFAFNWAKKVLDNMVLEYTPEKEGVKL